MNIQKMMQQAKQMQDKMQEMQEKLGDVIVEGAAGGGMVKVSMSCRGEPKSVSLDPSIINVDEKEILEDLIVAAMTDAKSKADQKMADETQKMMSEMGIPPGMAGNLPF